VESTVVERHLLTNVCRRMNDMTQFLIHYSAGRCCLSFRELDSEDSEDSGFTFFVLAFFRTRASGLVSSLGQREK